MSRKAYEIEFALSAKVGSNFGNSFSKAKEQLSSIQKEIASLSRTQSDISAYQKQQSALEQTQDKLALLKQEYDNIQKEIQETEGYSSSLENKLLNKGAQIEKTSAKVKEHSQALDKMGTELREAGINTDNLTQESGELSNKISTLKSKQVEAGESAKKMGGATVDAFRDMQEALVAAGILKAVKETAEAFVECSKASIEFESAITGVFKTVDGTDKQLSEITEGIKEMSTQIPATTTEISSVAEAAGQLGIARQDVLDFTRVMIDLGESTNLSADEAASSLAKFANITRTSSENYSRLGSVIVDLGNNLATTEADIVAMSTRLASAGTLAGLTEAEIMALAAAMSSVGIEAEAGGTAMTQTLSNIEMAVASGGESLEGFAKVAGMSALEFANAWENNAIGAVQSFIAGVGSLEDKGESAVLVLDELGLTGVRQSNMIKSLGLAAETLGQSIGIATNAWEENNALTIEAGKRYATTESQIAMLGNKFNNLKVAVGDTFNPALRETITLAGDTIVNITKFVKENPKAVQAIGSLTLGVGTMAGSIAVATLSVKAFNAVLNINPIIAITSGVLGLTTAMIALEAAVDASEVTFDELSASSQNDYNRIQALEEEYRVLCQTMPETSFEAQQLKREIDNATEAFENNKQTTEELAEAHREAIEAHKDFIDSYKESDAEIEKNEINTLALLTRLEELTAAETKSAESKTQILAITELLNEAIPELGLNYDSVTDSMNLTAEKVREIIEAEIAYDKFQNNRDALKTAISNENGLYTNWQKQKTQLEAAQKAYDDAVKAKNAADAAYKAPPSAATAEAAGRAYGGYIMPYSKAVSDAASALDDAKEAEAEAKSAYDENQAVIASLTSEVVNYTDAANNSTDASENAAAGIQSIPASAEEVNAFFEKAATSLEELITAYDEAYEAAYSSLSGQYSLWDQAAQVSAINTKTINANIEAQTTYWQSYRENLESLTAKADEIIGLETVLASFADGSEEAVNTIAGLVQASDEELEKFVQSWNELEIEKETISELIADLQVDLEAGIKNLQTTTEQGIEELNLDTQAAEAAKETFGAYVAEIDAKTYEAAQAVAKFKATINNVLSSDSSTPTFNAPLTLLPKPNSEPLWKTPWPTSLTGYATGTEHATPGLHWVGENGPELMDFAGGERVMTAEESAAFKENIRTVAMLSPALMAMSVYSERAAQSMALIDKSRSSPVSISVTFQIQGKATPETVASLESYGNEFAERVLEVMEEAGIDTLRRSYN